VPSLGAPAPTTAPAPPESVTNAPNATPAPPEEPPNKPITTVQHGTVPNVPGSPRDQLFTLTKNVNFVLVPVTVKDSHGQLVEGLLERDFSVYEDSVRQNITFFTSDPFPLSAAVVLDLGLPETDWRRVRETLPALVGAFSQFDEVALFTYSYTVHKVQGFTGANADLLFASMRNLKTKTGKVGGVPVMGGPMSGGPSPSVNGIPVQPNTPEIPTYTKESYVLNDAILAAASELGKREPTRRKVVFVVSDGRELGSSNNYDSVLKILLSQQISVYGIDLSGGGVPLYRELEKVRIPGQGYGDILPKYASATGGQVFAEIGQQAIEQAYSRVTEEARNQYTIGYTTPMRPASNYRSIEVRIHRPDLKVYARDGYYPLPPGK
jgi:VWFA-related protein